MTDAARAKANSPTEEDVAKAQEMTAPFRKQINETPALLSLLYDIDLLPEQIRLPVNAVRMSAFCLVFAKLTPEQIASLFVASDKEGNSQ